MIELRCIALASSRDDVFIGMKIESAVSDVNQNCVFAEDETSSLLVPTRKAKRDSMEHMVSVLHPLVIQ